MEASDFLDALQERSDQCEVCSQQEDTLALLAWRILKPHESEGWAQDLLGQLYLDEDLQVWAENDGQIPTTLDSNGVELHSGDSVYLIKDLDVKGASFVAKRGTTVRNMRVGDDPAYVEGKVNGTSLMIKTEFIKKV